MTVTTALLAKSGWRDHQLQNINNRTSQRCYPFCDGREAVRFPHQLPNSRIADCELVHDFDTKVGLKKAIQIVSANNGVFALTKTLTEPVSKFICPTSCAIVHESKMTF